MIILAIESSCDETSVSITDERKILSNIISTQIAEHKIYGGVVPEIASRRHTEAISHVCKEALKEAIQEYKGTILLVCHEAEFYQGVASRVINLEDFAL